MCAGSQERGDDGSSDESSDYSGSSDASSDVVSFVPIDKRNPHWSAAERRAEASSEPRRYSLYGNKTADALSKEREGGGLLGFSLSWRVGAPLRASRSIAPVGWAAGVFKAASSLTTSTRRALRRRRRVASLAGCVQRELLWIGNLLSSPLLQMVVTGSQRFGASASVALRSALFLASR